MNTFKRIELADWRQFSSVNIDFDRDLTVLTGPNGCGKTTILNVLSKHFGWALNFTTTPYYETKKGKKIWSDFNDILDQDLSQNSPARSVGKVIYSDGSTCGLQAPQVLESSQYGLTYQNEKPVRGLNIPSHRPVVSYQKINEIPTDPKNNEQQYQEYQQLMLQTYGSGNSRNPGLVLKKSLISLAVFGYGNNAVAANHSYIRLFEGFQDILKTILPKTLGFKKLEVRMPEIVLMTETGDFSIDAMSGGVSAIFGMAWQFYMFGATGGDCTVLIDEPENHLHPSLQREFLPSLRKAFPGYKFIISTHSPFIVSSDREAAVYALTYDNNKKICSNRLEEADLSASPNQILKDVLKVENSTPVWVEEKLKSILQKYPDVNPSKEKIEELYNELVSSGLVSSATQIKPKT